MSDGNADDGTRKMGKATKGIAPGRLQETPLSVRLRFWKVIGVDDVAADDCAGDDSAIAQRVDLPGDAAGALENLDLG